MTGKRVVDDPDFGPIEVATGPLSDTKWKATGDKVVAAMERTRLFPEGTIRACPVCKEKAFEGRNDLVLQFVRGERVLTFRRVHGGRCGSCRAQIVEPYEALALDDEAVPSLRGNYESKVAKVGGGSLGMYWPRDIQRLLGLKADRKAFIEVLDKDSVLVRFD